MVDELTLCPISRSAVASLSWLLDTHRKGRIGSPIVAGSSNRCKSSSSVGSFVVNRGLPPPSPRPPRSTADPARSERNEGLHTGCGGVIRRSSKRHRRWLPRQESPNQSMLPKSRTRFTCFWGSPKPLPPAVELWALNAPGSLIVAVSGHCGRPSTRGAGWLGGIHRRYQSFERLA